MALTEAHLAERRNWIGASDVPAILGVDPWRTAYDVWLDKTGQLEPHDDSDAAKDAGSLLEATVLDWYWREHCRPDERLVTDPGPIVRKEYCLAVRPDAIRLDVKHATCLPLRTPVEAKTTRIVGYSAEEWGEFGTDHVPPRVIVQCHAQMLAMGAGRCDVPALIGGRGFGLYVLARVEDLCDFIAEHCVAFWGCVTERRPPEGMPSLETAKRIVRQPGKVVSIPAEVGQRWAHERAARLAAEKAEADAMRDLLVEAMDGEVIDFGDPEHVVTYRATSTTRVDVKRLKAERPDVYKAYSNETTSRRMLLAKRSTALLGDTSDE